MSQKVREVFEQGQGIFRMMPVLCARVVFPSPGHRLRLHPDDYFALGTTPRRHEGALVLALRSRPTTARYAAEDEGLSYVALEPGRSRKRCALRDAVAGTGRGDRSARS